MRTIMLSHSLKINKDTGMICFGVKAFLLFIFMRYVHLNIEHKFGSNVTLCVRQYVTHSCVLTVSLDEKVVKGSLFNLSSGYY